MMWRFSAVESELDEGTEPYRCSVSRQEIVLLLQAKTVANLFVLMYVIIPYEQTWEEDPLADLEWYSRQREESCPALSGQPVSLRHKHCRMKRQT